MNLKSMYKKEIMEIIEHKNICNNKQNFKNYKIKLLMNYNLKVINKK